MKVREALQMGYKMLRLKTTSPDRVKDEDIHFECDLILASLLNWERHRLYTNPDYELDFKTVDSYISLLIRRAKNEPLQYLIGKREFMGLDFIVDNRVLIPRCDTEALVEFVIGYVGKLRKTHGKKDPDCCNSLAIYNSEAIQILDIGTGSGAIAVSLAKYIPDSFVTATDISGDALSVARENARNNGVEDRLKFVLSDLFEGFGSHRGNDTGRFHIIVSNPPYIPKSDISHLMPEVRDFEPIAALDGGKDGLDFYRRIAAKSPDFLKPHGLLAFEVGYGQAEQVAAILKSTGRFGNVVSERDLSGINRVVAAELIN